MKDNSNATRTSIQWTFGYCLIIAGAIIGDVASVAQEPCPSHNFVRPLPGFPRTNNSSPYFTLQCWEVGSWQQYWLDYSASERARATCIQRARNAWRSSMNDAGDEAYRNAYSLVVEAWIESGACLYVGASNPTLAIPVIGQVTTGTFLAGCWGITATRGLYNIWSAHIEFQIDSANADSAYNQQEANCVGDFADDVAKAQQTRDRSLQNARP